MPPFGDSWFRVMGELENGHPVAVLREHWMLLNVMEDDRLKWEERKAEIEYGGFFANPEVYFRMKGDKESTDNFEIVRDSSEYDRKLNAASTGAPDVDFRRKDVAEMVRRKRDEMERAQLGVGLQPPIPSSVDSDDDGLVAGSLIVEG
jgi:hypothetical protein